MPKKVLITSALPYANGPLHFGHLAGAYLPADCFARFQRLKGFDVLYVCGSDEHGIAITLSAQLAKCTPQQHVDKYHQINQDFFKKLNISFDHYSRTTWEGHGETTKQFFFDLLENGYIEKRETDQLYSEEDEQFLADRYVMGICPRCGYEEARGDECPHCGASYEATDLLNPISKVTGKKLIKKPTTHWFLLFDKFKDQLNKWLDEKQWKSNVVAFVKHYVDNLKPRAITRDSNWGIPVPLEEAHGKVFYVWFDAPIGYISATKQWAESLGEPDKWKDYWFNEETTYVQFIGKDNIPFHAIFFPAMIMGQNQPYVLVNDLPANEFYKYEGKQFSKSSNWYIDLEDFFKKFTVDQIRFAIASNAPETQDSEFNWKDFQNRCNADLLGKYGNLVNRVLTFIHNKVDKQVPIIEELSEHDRQFVEKIKELAGEISLAYTSYHLRKAAALVMELASLGNAFFDHETPWRLVKDPSLKPRLDQVLYACLYCLQILALVSFPIIPDMAEKLWKLLGNHSIDNLNWEDVLSQMPDKGKPLPKPIILTQKIEDEVIEKELNMLRKDEKQNKPSNQTNLIDYADFAKVELKVGKIIEAQKVEKSNKLLHLSVDFGDNQRSIVSGIAKHYEPSAIIGKKAIFVVNLKPAKLMGIPSEGMLLCASDGKILEIPTIDKMPIGARVS